MKLRAFCILNLAGISIWTRTPPLFLTCYVASGHHLKTPLPYMCAPLVDMHQWCCLYRFSPDVGQCLEKTCMHEMCAHELALFQDLEKIVILAIL